MHWLKCVSTYNTSVKLVFFIVAVTATAVLMTLAVTATAVILAEQNRTSS